MSPILAYLVLICFVRPVVISGSTDGTYVDISVSYADHSGADSSTDPVVNSVQKVMARLAQETMSTISTRLCVTVSNLLQPVGLVTWQLVVNVPHSSGSNPNAPSNVVNNLFVNAGKKPGGMQLFENICEPHQRDDAPDVSLSIMTFWDGNEAEDKAEKRALEVVARETVDFVVLLRFYYYWTSPSWRYPGGARVYDKSQQQPLFKSDEENVQTLSDKLADFLWTRIKDLGKRRFVPTTTTTSTTRASTTTTTRRRRSTRTSTASIRTSTPTSTTVATSTFATSTTKTKRPKTTKKTKSSKKLSDLEAVGLALIVLGALIAVAITVFVVVYFLVLKPKDESARKIVEPTSVQETSHVENLTYQHLSIRKKSIDIARKKSTSDGI